MTIQSIEVRLSTTHEVAIGLDNDDFDPNVGADQTTRLRRHAASGRCPATAARRRAPFELPSRSGRRSSTTRTSGNLLLEVYNLSATFPSVTCSTLEKHPRRDADDTSRLIEVMLPGTGEHQIPPVGTGSRGLVTQFVFTVARTVRSAMGLAAIFGLVAWNARCGEPRSA